MLPCPDGGAACLRPENSRLMIFNFKTSVTTLLQLGLIVLGGIVLSADTTVGSEGVVGGDAGVPFETIIAPRRVFKGVPSAERVAEIAKRLNPVPRGIGPSIEDRAAWAAFPNQQIVLVQAERMLAQPMTPITDDIYMSYKLTGSRDAVNAAYPASTQRLANFAVAECIENQGRYLPAIEAQLAAIFEERSWTPSFHDRNLESYNGRPIIDLGAAMRAWTLAEVDQLLGDKLTAETRVQIRQQIKHRVWDPYREQVEGKNKGSREWWMWGPGNWNAVCHAGVIGSALALIPDANERAWYVGAAELLTSNFLSGFPPDGYCSEGIVYWTYGVGHYVLMAEAIGRASDWTINLLTPEIIKPILSFPRRIEIVPGVYPAFSDNLPNIRPEFWVNALASRHMGGDVLPLTAVNGIAMHGHGAMLYQTMARAFPGGDEVAVAPVEPELALPLRDRFPDAGIVVSRTANPSRGSGWGVAFKGGDNNEFHNHNDVGSYVLVVNGSSLLTDPGAEDYTARTFSPSRYVSKVLNSYGHDVPVVAGQLQDTGAAAKGMMTVISATEEADTYLLDLTAAYHAAVPALQTLKRTLAFTRQPTPSLDVSDAIVFSTPRDFETALVTFGKVKMLSPHSFEVSDGRQAIQVNVGASGEFLIREEVINERLPLGQQPTRIGIKLLESAKEARISYHVRLFEQAKVQMNPVVAKEAADVREPQWGRAIRREAQGFVSETGGNVELTPKVDASGDTAIRRWDHDEHELAWSFDVPAAGTYGLLLRYCRGDAGEALRSLTIDGVATRGLHGALSFPATGGWSSARGDWREVWLAQNAKPIALALEAGTRRIALKNLGNSPMNLDWLELVPFKK
jgi:hypothetical protein